MKYVTVRRERASAGAAAVVPVRHKPDKSTPIPSCATEGAEQFEAANPVGGSGWIGLVGATGTGPSPEFLRRLMTWQGSSEGRQKEGSLAADQVLLNLWAPQQFPLKR
jgi:hypothetical protein